MLTVARVAAWCGFGQPLWACGMRPFFIGTAASGALLMGMWLLYLLAGWPLPASAGGPTVWHAHELLFGFALASALGFLLTAVPEFTATPDFGPVVVRRLALLWLVARAAFWATGLGGAPLVMFSGLLHVGLIGTLVALFGPRLWADPQRAHLSFLWVLLVLGACSLGFHVELLGGSDSAMRWLHASVGAYMVLIVVALGRISMRIVNTALDEAGQATDYLARPPRRNLVIVCITLYSTTEFALPGSRLSGWLALGTAAAVFHLLNDWHIGRPLFTRWPLMLYSVHLCMGLGYTLMGTGLLTSLGSFQGGRHLLLTGALGLAIFGAMAIAGRAHCGLQPDRRAWVPAAAAGLFLAAAVRAVAGWWLPDATKAWALSGALWCAAFLLYLGRLAPVLLGPRQDGRTGCQGVQDT